MFLYMDLTSSFNLGPCMFFGFIFFVDPLYPEWTLLFLLYDSFNYYPSLGLITPCLSWLVLYVGFPLCVLHAKILQSFIIVKCQEKKSPLCKAYVNRIYLSTESNTHGPAQRNGGQPSSKTYTTIFYKDVISTTRVVDRPP